MELWRVISKPKIERPKGFGSVEYFHRDQHCENPNPDLLAKHGVTMKASASKSSIRRFVITEKAPTRAFSWLKAATTAFTFKTLC